MTIIYSTSSCWHCNQFREELSKHGIDYEYKDLDDDKVREECIDLCKTSGNTELPVVITNSGKVLNRPTLEDIK